MNGRDSYDDPDPPENPPEIDPVSIIHEDLSSIKKINI